MTDTQDARALVDLMKASTTIQELEDRAMDISHALRAALDRADNAEAERDCLAALHGEDMALCTQLQHDAEDARAAGYAQGVRHVADRLRIMGDMGGQAIALALPQADAPAQENSHD